MALIGFRSPLTYHPWPWSEYTEEQKQNNVLYLMNRFTVCFGGVWRRIGRIQRGSLI